MLSITKNIKKLNKKRTITLFFLAFNVVLMGFVPFLMDAPLNEPIQANIENKSEPPEIPYQTPKASAYSNNFTNTTRTDLGVSLQQSYLNESFDTCLNASDSSNNTFTVPAPNESFNTTFINITINNIYAPNKTLIIEDGAPDANSDLSALEYLNSFKVNTSCLLRNASFYLRYLDAGTPTITVYLYNSTWALVDSIMRSKPDMVSKQIITTFLMPSNPGNYWDNIDLKNTFLNNSKTENGTWFLGMYRTTGDMGEDPRWRERDDVTDGIDSSEAYDWDSSTLNHLAVDHCLIVRVAPLNNTPNPVDIGLKINNTAVSGYDNINGSGYWTSENEYSSSPNNLTFEISADWWDVICNITSVQVNYTRLGLTATSTFNASLQEKNIKWNVSLNEQVTFFDSNFAHYTINFTIPSNWIMSSVKAYNYSTEFPVIDTSGPSINGYKNITVFGAKNGTNWYLTANSTNLLYSINTYVELDQTSFVNYSNTVRFEANFSTSITAGDGFINLSVYDPDLNYINFTSNNETYSTGKKISLANWSLSDTIDTYGKFRMQLFWHNDTAAGIIESNLTILADTDLKLISPINDSEYFKNDSEFNITVFYNDTGMQKPISADAVNFKNGTYNTGNLTPNGTEGYYYLAIKPADFGYGLNKITINASKEFYNNKTIEFWFSLVINTSITPSNQVDFLPSVTRGDNITYTFNYSNINGKIIYGANWSIIGSNHSFIGFLNQTVNGNYTIELNTSEVEARSAPYNYIFKISAKGNETQEINLEIQVLLPCTRMENISFTSNIPVGSNLTIQFYFNDTYNNRSIDDLYTDNVTITQMPDDTVWNRNDPKFPDNDGWLLVNDTKGNYTLVISTGNNLAEKVYTLKINITWHSPNPGKYNYSIHTITFTYGTPDTNGENGGGGGGGGSTPAPAPPAPIIQEGIPLEDLIFYITLIIIIGCVVGGSIGAYRGIVVPKKREKARALAEVNTMFDDAINLEHILVLYKGTGMCIFFKSFGSEEIDPELISGFLSAVSSFGREMESQEALNEITYGDKMLLLSDGDYIRVALVLNKKPSTILNEHLKEFIETFEKIYINDLPNWRGQLNLFRNAGKIVNEKLNTSIILPHEITYSFTDAKSLKSSYSKTVLTIANNLLKDSNRTFFFIATLLTEATERTKKSKEEIFMGIKELRDKKILVPIEISAIEEQPISQQEFDLINQKVRELTNLSSEETQKLVQELSQMGPAEREAYLASLVEQHEIVSAPVKSKEGAVIIDDAKSAKKEIMNLKKRAKELIKENEIQKAIEIYENATIIAKSWELVELFEELKETIRINTIEDLKKKAINLEKEAKTAQKAEVYGEAAQKYKEAAKLASEIFKLGVTEMTKEVKRLTNKSKECEKLG